MSTHISRTAVSLGLLCLGAAAPALAEPETRSVLVRIADLNLATAAGEHALHGRITRAVGLVCGDIDPRNLEMSSAIRRCRAAAMANAMPQMQVAVANARSASGYAANDTRISRSAS